MKEIQAEPQENKKGLFTEMGTFMKNGKVKSTLLVYSFTAAILFCVFYFVFFMLFVDPIDGFLQRFSLSVGWINFFENWIPALLASIFCNGLHFIVKDKRIVPAAYLWILLLLVLSMVYAQATYDSESLKVFWYFFLMLIPGPLVTGCVLSFIVYWLYLRKEKERLKLLEGLPRELPSWKRKVSQ